MLLDNEDEVVGNIHAEGYDKKAHAKAFQKLTQGLSGMNEDITTHNLTTTPKAFPEGPNNYFIKDLTYKFSMSTYNVGILHITDAEKTRWSIPEYAVNKEKKDSTMRTEMLGLKVF